MARAYIQFDFNGGVDEPKEEFILNDDDYGTVCLSQPCPPRRDFILLIDSSGTVPMELVRCV